MFVQLIKHLFRDKQKRHVLTEWPADVELVLDRFTSNGDTEGVTTGDYPLLPLPTVMPTAPP